MTTGDTVIAVNTMIYRINMTTRKYLSNMSRGNELNKRDKWNELIAMTTRKYLSNMSRGNELNKWNEWNKLITMNTRKYMSDVNICIMSIYKLIVIFDIYLKQQLYIHMMICDVSNMSNMSNRMNMTTRKYLSNMSHGIWI